MNKVILLMVMIFSTTHLFAADGSSGCGPGWYVAKENSLLSSSIRATTNGILVPTVTFGMTFGTSNCQKHSIVKLEKERIKFATENYFEIAADSAKGSGQFVAAYGELMGCNPASLQKFSNQMKKHFPKIFNAEEINPENLVKQTYIMMLKNSELTQACFQV